MCSALTDGLEHHIQALIGIAGGIRTGHEEHELVAAGGVRNLHAAVCACGIPELAVKPLLLQVPGDSGVEAVEVHDLLARGGGGNGALVDLIEADELPLRRAVIVDVLQSAQLALQRLV